VLENFAHDNTTKTLLNYWQSLPRAAGKLCPFYSDFHLLDISEVADHIFVEEHESDACVCLVQVGAALTNILGVDLTGHNILLLLSNSEALLEREYFRALRDKPCAGSITRASQDKSNRSFIYYTTHLPLLDAEGKVRFWVGSGAELDTPRKLTKPSPAIFGGAQLLERECFDIGAGIPDLSLAEPSYS
jgi:hypothetical protein